MRSFVSRNWSCLVASRMCFASFALSIPVITEYWEYLGLERSGGFYLQIVFALGLVVLEVVTGKAADIFGRRICLIAAGLTGMTGALAYAYADSFVDLAVAELLLALSLALNSGTEEALLYESFERDAEHGISHARNFHDSWKVLFRIGFWCMVPCSAAAGYLFTSNPRLTWYVLIVAMAVRTICYCLVRETYRTPAEEADRTQHIMKACKLLFCTAPALRWITVVICIVAGITQSAVWSYTPQFREQNWSLIEIGWVFAIFHVVAGLSAVGRKSAKAQTCSDVVLWILLLGSSSALGFLLLGLCSGAWIVLAAVPLQLVRGGLTWVFSDFYQTRTPGNIRASVGSVRSAAGLLIYACLLLPYALLVDHISRSSLLVGVGALLVTFLLAIAGQLRARCNEVPG